VTGPLRFPPPCSNEQHNIRPADQPSALIGACLFFWMRYPPYNFASALTRRDRQSSRFAQEFLSNRFSRTSRLAQRKRSGSASEVVAEAVQEWITAIGAKTAYIERGSPWESGYIESFNARLRDELLKGTQS
jgi:transposase InsO family protein